MRKGQWSSWDGVRVVNGKIAQDINNQISKMGNIICEYEGIKFQSKKERDYYKNNLLPRYKRGEVKWFLRQVRFDLPGKIIYRADFLEVWTDGSVHVVDCKGYRTYPYKMKKKLLESAYPVRIEER